MRAKLPQKPRATVAPPRLPGVGHVGVFGKTQFGKSTWTRKALESAELTAAGRRVFVVDAKGDWRAWCLAAGFMFMTADELLQAPGYLLTDNVCLMVPDRTPRAAGRAFRLLARLVHARQIQCVVVAEEVGSYAEFCREELHTLATQGLPHCRLLVVAQRPAIVPKTVRSQLDALVLFHVDEPGDVEAVVERTRDESLAAVLPSLPVGAHRAWVAGLVQHPNPIPPKESHPS